MPPPSCCWPSGVWKCRMSTRTRPSLICPDSPCSTRGSTLGALRRPLFWENTMPRYTLSDDASPVRQILHVDACDETRGAIQLEQNVEGVLAAVRRFRENGA